MERHVQRYSVNVRQGNWVEDAWSQSVVLDTAEEFLRYGQDAQIVCPDFRFPIVSGGGGVVLSCSAGNSDTPDGLGPDCTLTASEFTEPCVRNCFKISGLLNGCEDGQPVKFGDTFNIIPCVSSKPLFAAVVIPRLHEEDRALCGHAAVKLSGSPDSRCRWTVEYWNGKWRMEAEGLPVPIGTRVVVKHADTDLNLAVEKETRFSHFFGNEFEVSAYSYKDSAGCEAVQNVWQFVTSSGGRTGGDDGKTT
ncbi:Hypothetical protein CINCED_3A005919 [Cinara cedri]|uniref:Uncharacterized protein n=1 Tax=Cinara cedri TaxID=506608 RepID=A0A5E4M2R2_9HEMI|nr:Hypothetical protein CINCED_3A005919 [Cinara cedri]